MSYDKYDAEADVESASHARHEKCNGCGHCCVSDLVDGKCCDCFDGEAEPVYPESRFREGGEACPPGKCYCGDCKGCL